MPCGCGALPSCYYERYASNLTRELPKYGDTQIEKLLDIGAGTNKIGRMLIRRMLIGEE